MHIYFAIKYHPDQKNREQIETICAMLVRAGASTCCIVRDIEQWGAVKLTPAELMRRSFSEIDRSDLVLVEITEKGVGLGIEAGYAHARSIPVLTVIRRGGSVSTTLLGISTAVLEYTQWEDLEQELSRYLKDAGYPDPLAAPSYP